MRLWDSPAGLSSDWGTTNENKCTKSNIEREREEKKASPFFPTPIYLFFYRLQAIFFHPPFYFLFLFFPLLVFLFTFFFFLCRNVCVCVCFFSTLTPLNSAENSQCGRPDLRFTSVLKVDIVFWERENDCICTSKSAHTGHHI